MNTTSELLTLIEAAEKEASQGCGQSDALYEERVQAAYAHILERAPEAERPAVGEILKARGFNPDFESYQIEDGCAVTGIDENCCPCGQHP